MKYITQYFDITTTTDEIYYLTDILNKCRYSKKTEFDTASVQVQMLTRRFISKVSEYLSVSLENDYEFFESLSDHMESMMAASAENFPANDVLQEIVEENEDIKDAVMASLGPIETFAGRKLTENEILYIIIHVCAAMERKKNKDVAFHVVVSCHAGIGTSHLLMERLKKHFNFHIVDIISSHAASDVTPEKADLIISTVPLKNVQVEHVVVSPIMTDEDYIRVGNKIDALRNSRNISSRVETNALTAKGLIEILSPIVMEQIPDEALAKDLMKTLRKEIRGYFRQTAEVEQEIFVPYLHHLLNADHIQLDVECSDWKDSIRQSALPLLKDYYIEERYIDAMIQNVEENGPYIVISPGFALAHEGIEAGSVQVGMNLIRLAEPVAFDADEYDPVEFVCCLSAIDHKTHLKALFNLVNLLANNSFKEEMRQAKSPEELAGIIERYEHQLEQ